MTVPLAHRARPAGPARRPARRPLPPGTTALVVRSVIAAGAVAVLALWWRDTERIAGPAQWLTGAGRISGLLAPA